MADIPEYVKFTFTSKKDPSTGAFPIADYNKDIRNIVNNAVKSALPSDAFYYVGDKNISKQGKMSVDVYVHKDEATAVSKASRYLVGKMDYIDDTGASIGSKYTVTRARGLPADVAQSLYHIETAPARKEEERKQREEEKEQKKEEQEDKKAKDASMRVLHGAILKVIAVLAGIADITRRILSSVIGFSTQAVQDSRLAHNLGLSYDQVRAYRNTEIAHSMKEGTITGAIADVQNKFGNITSLDEKSLEALAVVMGNQIEDMAKMGIGASNPEAIVGAIVDAFNAKANAGYNSVGQYVGEQQARRELYSYLNKISPQIADIFATMQEEQHNINSLFRGQADTFAQWKSLLPTSRGMPTSMEYNVTATLGQEWGVIKSILEQLKQSVANSIAPTLLTVLRTISNFRIGYSETENRKLNETNKEANTKALNQTNQTISLMENAGELSEADTYYLSALRDYKAELEKANKGTKKGHIYYAVRTPEELRVMALKKAKAGAESSLGGDFKLESMKNAGSGAPYVSALRLTDEVLPEADEVADVVNAYPNLVNIDKARREYEEDRRKQFGIEKEAVLKQALQAKREEAEARANEEAYNAVYKDKSSPYYRNIFERMNVRDTKATATVAYIESLFNTKLEGKNIDQKLADAVAKGYAYYGADQIVRSIPLTDEMFSDSDFVKATIRDLRDKYAYNEEDFLLYLYENNKDKFKEHIEGARYDQLKQDLETGNLYSSVFALLSTEGTLEDWRLKLPSTYTGGGITRTYNEELDNNEVVHKIVLDYKGQSYELGSFLGMKGGTGKIGEIAVTPEGAKVITTASVVNTQQTPASKARPYYSRSTGIQE